MAFVSFLSLPSRSESPMPRHHAGLRSVTPSRAQPVPSRPQGSRDRRYQSTVRARSEYKGGRSNVSVVQPLIAESDCFSTLGLAPTASAPEIKQAYRTLAKKYHPDANPTSGATSKFVDLRSAYEMCLVKESRAARSSSVPASTPRKVVRQATEARPAGRTPASSTNASPVRSTSRRSKPLRRDAWDDIWDEMLSSPKASRRRR